MVATERIVIKIKRLVLCMLVGTWKNLNLSVSNWSCEEKAGSLGIRCVGCAMAEATGRQTNQWSSCRACNNAESQR